MWAHHYHLLSLEIIGLERNAGEGNNGPLSSPHPIYRSWNKSGAAMRNNYDIPTRLLSTTQPGATARQCLSGWMVGFPPTDMIYPEVFQKARLSNLPYPEINCTILKRLGLKKRGKPPST